MRHNPYEPTALDHIFPLHISDIVQVQFTFKESSTKVLIENYNIVDLRLYSVTYIY